VIRKGVFVGGIIGVGYKRVCAVMRQFGVFLSYDVERWGCRLAGQQREVEAAGAGFAAARLCLHVRRRLAWVGD